MDDNKIKNLCKYRVDSIFSWICPLALEDHGLLTKHCTVEEFISKNPKWELTGNNCEVLAKALGSQVIDGSYPTRVKTKAAVAPLVYGQWVEGFVKIIAEDNFDDAQIYDPKGEITKASNPVDIDEVTKKEK